ncbi:MAG: oxidoreductase, partial [Actinomycetota bacterium]|nr:oxidoreductase [Actinomycetota bacterium]
MTDATDRPAVPLAGPVPTVATGGSFRSQLKPGADVVDPEHWPGSVPVAHGIAPRVRLGQCRWFNLLWLLPIGFVLLLIAVATAKGLRGTDTVQGFISDYPGTVEPSAGSPVGTPWWVGLSHFLNLFLMAFILRSGLQ